MMNMNNVDKSIIWKIIMNIVEEYYITNDDMFLPSKICSLRLVCKQFKDTVDKFFIPCEMCFDAGITSRCPYLGICIKNEMSKEIHKCPTCEKYSCTFHVEVSENDPYIGYPDFYKGRGCIWCAQ